MQIKIINKCKYGLPKYATEQSAGMDLYANMNGEFVLYPGERTLILTGIFIQLPIGYEAQIRPRSGLSYKKGLVAILGTIDADYRGEVGVILVNLSREPITINPGDRIAQMVIAKHEKAQWVEVETLENSERGTGGFGHTGVNKKHS